MMVKLLSRAIWSAARLAAFGRILPVVGGGLFGSMAIPEPDDGTGGSAPHGGTRESTEARLQMMVDTMSDCIYRATLTRDGASFTDWVIGPIEQLCGHTTDTLNQLPQGWFTLVHPHDLAQVQRTIAEMEVSSEPQTVEYRIIHKSGAVRWVRDTVSLVSPEENASLIVVGAIKDITDPMQVREQYREVLRTSMDGFWMNDDSGRLLDVNDTICEILGYTRDEMLNGLHVGMIDVGATPEELRVRANVMMRSGRVRFETIHRCKDGTLLDVEISSYYQESTGRFYVFSRDIGDQKRSEAALRQSEERYRMLAEYTHDLVCLHDPDGRYLYVSPSVVSLLGYAPDELLHTDMYGYIHEDDGERFRKEAHERVLRGESPIRIEYRVRSRSGAVVWLETAVQAITQGGSVVRLVSSSRDITERVEAQRRLQESELRFQLFMNHFPGDVFIRSLEDRTLYSNRAAVSLAGQTAEDGHGVQDAAAAGGEATSRAVEENAEVIRAGHQVEFEHEVVTPEGETYWSTIKFPIQMNGDESLIGVISMDVTQRRKAEDAIMRRSRQLSLLNDVLIQVNASLEITTILELACDGLTALFETPHTMAALLNDAETQIVMLTFHNPDDAVTLPPQGFHLVHDHVIAAMKRQASPFIFQDLQAELGTDPFGQVMVGMGIVSLMLIPVISKDQLVGMLGVGWGERHTIPSEETTLAITAAHAISSAIRNSLLHQQVILQNDALEERVIQRTRDLRQSEARYRGVVESQRELVCSFRTTDHRVLFANTAFLHFVNKRLDEIIGGNVLALLPTMIHGRLQADIRMAAESRRTVINEYQFAVGDRVLWLEMACQPIVDDGGRVVEIQMVGHDITLRKQEELALQLALDKEKQVGEMRSRFISIASHELRNPLASIQMAANMLESYLDRIDEAKRRTYFARIHEQVKRMNALLEDVLVIGRAESGRLRFDPILIDIVDFCGRISDSFQLLAPANIRLEVRGDPVCTFVETDENLLSYILNNLISNAIKYSPDGGDVIIRLRCDVENVTIEVQDHGIGIPPADQEHLFTAFHRARNVGQIEGTGLGLLITKQAVELHNGSLHFVSTEGGGSTFVVTLPVSQKGRYV